MSKLKSLAAALGLLLVAAPDAPAQVQGRTVAVERAAAMSTVVFDGVTVVDVEQGRLVADQRVVVAGTRIRAVGAVSQIASPQGARLVDARGKYLIPGLWDMHVHTMLTGTTPFLLASDVLGPYFIANGITGLRDMHGPFLDSLLSWRREIAAGRRVGPRLVVTGGTIASPGEISVAGHGPEQHYFAVTTAAEARQAVRALKQAGVDFIKIHDEEFSREIFFAIAAEARRLGIPFAGHPVQSVSAAEASDSGLLSFEHPGEQVCLPNWIREDSSGPTLADCQAIAKRLAKNNTWVMPFTLWGLPGGIRGLPLCAATVADSAAAPCTNTPPAWTVLPILAGTDFAGGSDFDVNQSLEEERAYFRRRSAAPVIGSLRYLVAHGMTPAQALRTATLNPAKALRATDSLGTVAAGKLADLVLLSANPLADIGNTTKVEAVVANGRYFDRAALDALLAPTP